MGRDDVRIGGRAPWLLGGIDAPAFVPCLCYSFAFRSNIFRMGEHSVKGNIFIEGEHCGKGRDLNGERIYNGVGGFLIVGANYFPPPRGFVPLKSRRRETF